ncbi:unnamed protein product [Eruca vesicaria subsp. sativa]|uniref:Dephospho-CoA kinase n=1 Tax=Eruca vesicaria subsp. sativa TaxID=29727 RepID=A0ABC8KG44_ERUVS|nr:unnamed protein product [Eruca vesicaria subsp. sativa]
MRIVGLTGGIASGKSTVSNLFKASGIPVVDADVIARNVLKKGSGGWKRVVAAFGEEILLPSREVDRPKLGQMVFSSDSKRQILNKLMAPYISSAKMDKWIKPIVVVWVSQETQLKRLIKRDGLSEEDARNRVMTQMSFDLKRNRVMAQMSFDLKRSKADIVIDNNGGLDELHQQFDKVLSEITRPLTWIEFWRSRQGAFSILGLVTSGLFVYKQLN